MRSELKRRDFILQSFRGILLSGLPPFAFSQSLFRNIEPVKENRNTPLDDLVKLKSWIADKQKPLKWIFTGDSITQGAKHTLGYRSYPEIFSEHVRFEINRSRDIVINTAVSGNTTMEIKNDFVWRISQFLPNVVFIMIGTNDAARLRHITVDTFSNNLKTLVQKIRSFSAIPVLQTPNTIRLSNDPANDERGQLPLYVDEIRAVAKQCNTILIDHWDYWETNRDKVFNEVWLNDPIHPNGKGHIEMARLLFNTLGLCDDRSFTCVGKVAF